MIHDITPEWEIQFQIEPTISQFLWMQPFKK